MLGTTGRREDLIDCIEKTIVLFLKGTAEADDDFVASTIHLTPQIPSIKSCLHSLYWSGTSVNHYLTDTYAFGRAAQGPMQRSDRMINQLAQRDAPTGAIHGRLPGAGLGGRPWRLHDSSPDSATTTVSRQFLSALEQWAQEGRGPRAPLPPNSPAAERPAAQAVDEGMAPSPVHVLSADEILAALAAAPAVAADPAIDEPLEAIAGILGGASALGRTTASADDLARAVEDGFPAAVLAQLRAAGFRQDELARFVAPERTLKRRRAEGRLTPQESDGAVRAARLLALAERTLGGRAAALEWLRSPKRSLGGRSPIEAGATETGARRVAGVLVSAELGMTA
jgi:putative toxin-antitoxin system antitoxin component (TIGR02293 family)